MGNMSGSYGSHYTLANTITVNSQSVANNTSNVTVKLTLTFDGSSYYAYTNNSTSGTMTVNGTKKSYSVSSIVYSSGTKKTITLATWTGDISHNSDGTKTLSVSGTWDTNTSRIGSGSCSLSKTLTTIPRKSSVTATSTNIGSNSIITINRASSSFTHTLTYTFGSLSGTIATKTTSTSVGWTLPDSFYGQIPNAKSGTGTITCTTYSGSTSLGTSTCSFTANAVESSAKPTVTATVIDINSTTVALTGNSSNLVLNASTARIVITSTLNKNAGSIKSVTINGTNVGTTASITKEYTNVTTGTFTIVVTDSRGYSTTVNLTPTTINYIPLSLSANIYRPAPTTGEISMNYSGNYFNGSFGSVSNILTVSYKYKLSTDSSYTTGTATITPTISENKYSRSTTSLGTSFTYTNAYNFVLTVSDKISTVSSTIRVNQGQPVFYWTKDDVRFNKIAISKYTDGGFKHIHPTTGTTMTFGVGVGGYNRGIFDTSSSQWDFLVDSSNNVYVSANAHSVYLRPNGVYSTTGQAELNTSGNLSATNFVGKLNGYELDLSTENQTDTWIPVLHGRKIQHKVIPANFEVRRGSVTITPSAANTPTGKAVTWTAMSGIPTCTCTAGTAYPRTKWCKRSCTFRYKCNRLHYIFIEGFYCTNYCILYGNIYLKLKGEFIMTDMNGKEIKIGDKIKPIGEGRELLIVSEFDNIEELGHCLFGQQIADPFSFSPLTQENLSSQWIIVE